MDYAVRKRRERGRAGEKKLMAAAKYISDNYCQRIPESHWMGMPNPFGFRPHWPDENILEAHVLLWDLARIVHIREVLAQEAA